MRFRPCIDIHHGKVRQIVGGSLRDEGASPQAKVNFTSDLDAAWYAARYAADGLRGGHIILLDPAGSEFYDRDVHQALEALKAAPGLLQAGGGITPENAQRFLDAGASHVIVTSYVFSDGKIDAGHLDAMVKAVGKDHLVLDLSCRQRADDGAFVVVTDRWQKYTDVELSVQTLRELSGSCDEFLVHAADVEGKQAGPQLQVVKILGDFCAKSGVPVTYAGGIHSFDDLSLLRTHGCGLVDVTIGSALDLFGGPMPYREVAAAGGCL